MIGDRRAQAALFQLTGVGVVETDLTTGRFRRVNETFCEMVGYSEVELQAMTYLELTHPDDRERDSGTFAALQRGELKEGASLTRVRHKDGSVRWLELHVTLVEEGDAVTNLAVVNDVTERRRAEEALRRAAELDAFRVTLNDALRPLADSVAVQRAATRVLGEWLRVDRTLYAEVEADAAHFVIADNHVRGGFPKMTGRFPLGDYGRVPDSQHQGETLVLPDVNAVDDSDAHLAAFRAVGAVAIIGVPLRKGGRWVASLTVHHGSPRAWTPEEVELVGETAERTWAAVERARAEAALRESEERLRLTVESIRDYAVFTLDSERRVTSWNSGAERLFGYRPDEIIGVSSDRLFTLENRQAGVPEQEARTALEEGRADDDRWHLRRDGGRFFASGVVTPLRNGEQTTGFVKVARDLTEQREAELERERLLAQLKELNETLEQRVAERTEALAQSERRFSRAFFANPIPACMTTRGVETFVEVNDAFSRLTGYARDEVVGKTVFELGMWSSRNDQRKLENALADGRGFSELDLHLRDKAGGAHDILLSATPIPLDGREGFLKMLYDVTERKESEALVHRAISEVMSDTSWFSQKVLEQLANIRAGKAEAFTTVDLTRREREVLEQLAQGLNNDAIAAELGVATQTVRNYISTVYDKLGVHTRSEAIVWARERGITGGRPER